MNPFIELTPSSLDTTSTIMINVNHIVCYNSYLLKNGTRGCYIVLANGSSTRYVQESYQYVNKLIQEFYTSTQND